MGSASWKSYGAGTATDIAGIEEELTRQWEEAQEGGAALVHRVRVLTLVAYSTAALDSEQMPRLLGLLAARHPCRVIAITHRPESAEDRISAEAATYCAVAPGVQEPGGRQVCCEEIRLSADGPLRREIRAAVAALVVPNLPSCLWWQGELDPSNELLEEMAEVSDRAIFDSGTFSSLAQGLVRIERLSAAGACDVSDLEWARLLSWRRLLARVFDPPDVRPYLSGITGVSVAVSAGEGGGAKGIGQALYLLAWLSERLGWTAQTASRREGELALEFGSRSGPVSAVIGEVSSSSPQPGESDERSEIASIEITARSPFGPTAPDRQVDAYDLRLIVRRTPERGCVSIRVVPSGDRVEPRTARLASRDTVELVLDELGLTRRDFVYEKTLAALVPILQLANPVGN